MTGFMVCTRMPGEDIPRIYRVNQEGIASRVQQMKAGIFNKKTMMLQTNSAGLELIRELGGDPIQCPDVEIYQISETSYSRAQYHIKGVIAVTCLIRVRRKDGSFSIDWLDGGKPGKHVEFPVSFQQVEEVWKKYYVAREGATLQRMLYLISLQVLQQVQEEAIAIFEQARQQASLPPRTFADWEVGKCALQHYLSYTSSVDQQTVWDRLFEREKKPC